MIFEELASTLPMEVQWKLEELVKWFSGRGGPVVVAFSGDVDSRVSELNAYLDGHAYLDDHAEKGVS